MSDTRSRPARRPASGKKRETVGGAGGSSLPVVFIGSVIAVVLAFVVLLAVAVDAFSGDDGTPSSPGDGTAVVGTPVTADTATPPTSEQTPTREPTAAPTLDQTGAILVACGDILAPVDKQHRLPSTCVPPDLQSLPAEYSSGSQRMRAEARDAIVEMFAAAKAQGFALYVNSSFRSFEEQSATYNYWVSVSGKEYADRTSARAGHSEHQLGTTADVAAGGKELEDFSGTPEAAWVAANAYKYGFIVSYPDGKEAITGYASEPWHVRYVGKAVAQQVKDSGLTLHEFLLK